MAMIHEYSHVHSTEIAFPFMLMEFLQGSEKLLQLVSDGSNVPCDRRKENEDHDSFHSESLEVTKPSWVRSLIWFIHISKLYKIIEFEVHTLRSLLITSHYSTLMVLVFLYKQ